MNIPITAIGTIGDVLTAYYQNRATLYDATPLVAEYKIGGEHIRVLVDMRESECSRDNAFSFAEDYLKDFNIDYISVMMNTETYVFPAPGNGFLPIVSRDEYGNKLYTYSKDMAI